MDQGLEQPVRGGEHYTKGVKIKKKEEEGTGSREGRHRGARGCARPKTCVHSQVRCPGAVLREKPHLPQHFRGAKSPMCGFSDKPKRFLPSVLREGAQSLGRASSSRPLLGVSHCEARVKMEACQERSGGTNGLRTQPRVSGIWEGKVLVC